jgi:hypothetical protein
MLAVPLLLTFDDRLAAREYADPVLRYDVRTPAHGA